MTQPSSPCIRGVDPGSLAPSEMHVRDTFSVSDEFVRNIREVGLVEPPIVRTEAGELRVVDGMRRVLAAVRAGLSEVPVIEYDLDETEALSASLTANMFRKAVSDRDEEAALRSLVGGPRRPLGEWERDDDVFQAKRDLGLADESDEILREIGGAEGVGEATAIALANEFRDIDAVLDATVDELEETDGIGPKTAQSIRDHIDGVGLVTCHEGDWGSE